MRLFTILTCVCVCVCVRGTPVLDHLSSRCMGLGRRSRDCFRAEGFLRRRRFICLSSRCPASSLSSSSSALSTLSPRVLSITVIVPVLGNPPSLVLRFLVATFFFFSFFFNSPLCLAITSSPPLFFVLFSSLPLFFPGEDTGSRSLFLLVASAPPISLCLCSGPPHVALRPAGDGNILPLKLMSTDMHPVYSPLSLSVQHSLHLLHIHLKSVFIHNYPFQFTHRPQTLPEMLIHAYLFFAFGRVFARRTYSRHVSPRNRNVPLIFIGTHADLYYSCFSVSD